MHATHIHRVLAVFFISFALLAAFVTLLGDEMTGMIVQAEEGIELLKSNEQVEIHDKVLRVDYVNDKGAHFTVFANGKHDGFVALGQSEIIDGLDIAVTQVFNLDGSLRDRVQVVLRDVAEVTGAVPRYGGEILLRYGAFAALGESVVRVTPATQGVVVHIDDAHTTLDLHGKTRLAGYVVEVIDFADFSNNEFDRITLRLRPESSFSSDQFDAVVGDAVYPLDAEVFVLGVTDNERYVHMLVDEVRIAARVGAVEQVGRYVVRIYTVDNYPGELYDRAQGTITAYDQFAYGAY